MNWADILLLHALSKYYQIRFKFTPAIKYGADLEHGIGHFEKFLIEDPPNITQSHLYMKQAELNDILIYDPHGSKRAKDFATTLQAVSH